MRKNLWLPGILSLILAACQTQKAVEKSEGQTPSQSILMDESPAQGKAPAAVGRPGAKPAGDTMPGMEDETPASMEEEPLPMEEEAPAPLDEEPMEPIDESAPAMNEDVPEPAEEQAPGIEEEPSQIPDEDAPEPPQEPSEDKMDL